jgi:hypothetical protein
MLLGTNVEFRRTGMDRMPAKGGMGMETDVMGMMAMSYAVGSFPVNPKKGKARES